MREVMLRSIFIKLEFILGYGKAGAMGPRPDSEHLEIEQKFDVPPDFERPDFAALAGSGDEPVTAVAPVRHHLSATYFDTADGRLAASKITLRRRTGGTDAGWHLKLPAGLADPGEVSARREVHAPLGDSGEREVPESLAARVAEVTGGLPLAPVATLDTERTVVSITAPDGRVVAEIADDAVTARRTGGPELRWREIEVEVPAPAPALQRAAAGLLLAAGAAPAGHASKLSRVLSS
jgi:inorganic triphosphatase YgiF